MVLRCTARLLAIIYPNPRPTLASLAPNTNDWYANLVWIERRKCLLLTHAGTLFSMFLPDVRAAELRPVGRFVVPAIESELITEGLPCNTFGPLDPENVVVARTANRSVLGCMNDMASMIESSVPIEGGLQRRDVADLNRGLRRHINSAGRHVPPIELAARWRESLLP